MKLEMYNILTSVARYSMVALITVALFSCQDYLKPAEDNTLTEEELFSTVQYAMGILDRAYIDLPDAPPFGESYATDNAVTNDKASSYRFMANGAWKSSDNPIAKWESSYRAIYYINYFLENIERIQWWTVEVNTEEARANHKAEILAFKQRMKGEAYGLRAYYQFQLLKYHAGKGSNGDLLGFPIVIKTLSPEESRSVSRNSFEDCVHQIIADCDSASLLLPGFYGELVYPDSAAYRTAMGVEWINCINGNAARTIKSMVTLYAASPAYLPSQDNWARAANAAGELIDTLGGVGALSSKLDFYTKPDKKEIIWRSFNLSTNKTTAWEEDHYPPALLGRGRLNPTEDLAASFPMKNGYPISHPASGYDPENPYKNRDGRFNLFLVYNGSKMKDSTIYTHLSDSKNGINQLETSTRTGYYLRKFLNEKVTLSPPKSGQPHYNTYFRLTEVFLNYAEAANEAWGPDASPEFGFTARDIIAALRIRAGISSTDEYLQSLTTKEQFRELIRNERRLELCFEGHRFWDIRRWKATAPDNSLLFMKPVHGMFIQINQDETFTFNVQVVEPRNYKEHMIYGPIPYNEQVNFNLTQNKGW